MARSVEHIAMSRRDREARATARWREGRRGAAAPRMGMSEKEWLAVLIMMSLLGMVVTRWCLGTAGRAQCVVLHGWHIGARPSRSRDWRLAIGLMDTGAGRSLQRAGNLVDLAAEGGCGASVTVQRPLRRPIGGWSGTAPTVVWTTREPRTGGKRNGWGRKSPARDPLSAVLDQPAIAAFPRMGGAPSLLCTDTKSPRVPMRPASCNTNTHRSRCRYP